MAYEQIHRTYNFVLCNYKVEGLEQERKLMNHAKTKLNSMV
jgi:hypothetical protein